VEKGSEHFQRKEGGAKIKKKKIRLRHKKSGIGSNTAPDGNRGRGNKSNTKGSSRVVGGWGGTMRNGGGEKKNRTPPLSVKGGVLLPTTKLFVERGRGEGGVDRISWPNKIGEGGSWGVFRKKEKPVSTAKHPGSLVRKNLRKKDLDPRTRRVNNSTKRRRARKNRKVGKRTNLIFLRGPKAMFSWCDLTKERKRGRRMTSEGG